MSDIHFEPFRDPGKVSELAASPVTEWDAILAAPPSPDREQRFAALQSGCHARGIDTSYTLLESSLRALEMRASQARFVTVSGDLISHAFPCKYQALFPKAAPGDYRAFVIKAEEYVLGKLRSSFPGVPFYAALGNNDTACGDYQLDERSGFLAAVGKALVQGLPPSERQSALTNFAVGGYYSAALPAPMENTRLIVLNDLFLSRRYLSCAGRPNSEPADLELAWLRQELARARQQHERVWVMGHIPPGVDIYSTVLAGAKICGGRPPVMFLPSGRLEALLVDFDDVIRLGVFGHTHMDEVRLLRPAAGIKPSLPAADGVAVKIVASISPVDGNNPSFTVARVDPVSAMLDDYQVFSASNQTGIDATWSQEYDFAQSYHQTVFSPSSLAQAINGFQSDPAAKTVESEDYLRHFFVGDRSALLKVFWPQYVCALANTSEQTFRSCACSAARQPAGPNVDLYHGSKVP